MSSLWTPEGEHRVERPGADPPARQNPSSSSISSPGPTTGEAPPYDELSPEEAAQLREVTQEIVSTPVEDVVANHCYGLFELAALHLSQQPPNLNAARTAIDSMGYLVDGLGERLGHHASTLSEGLSQLRLAFVAIANAPAEPDAEGSPTDR